MKEKLFKDCVAKDIVMSYDKIYKYKYQNTLDGHIVANFNKLLHDAIIKIREAVPEISDDDLYNALEVGLREGKKKLDNNILNLKIKVIDKNDIETKKVIELPQTLEIMTENQSIQVDKKD